jgi:hypothetical protein
MANWKNKQWEGESIRKRLASGTKRLKNQREEKINVELSRKKSFHVL